MIVRHLRTTTHGFVTTYSSHWEIAAPNLYGENYRVVFVAMSRRGKIFRAVVSEEFGQINGGAGSIFHSGRKMAARSSDWRVAIEKMVRRSRKMEIDPVGISVCVADIIAAMHGADSTTP